VSFTLQIGRSAEIPFEPSAPVATGANFVFTAKKTINSDPVISTTNITYNFDAQTGIVHLVDADTAPLTPGSWLCDVQAIISSSQNYVIAETSFTATIPVRGPA
jgi:hypothetical protein